MPTARKKNHVRFTKNQDDITMAVNIIQECASQAETILTLVRQGKKAIESYLQRNSTDSAVSAIVSDYELHRHNFALYGEESILDRHLSIFRRLANNSYDYRVDNNSTIDA